MKRVISGLGLLLCALFTACDQEPLFWDISREYPPIEPIIKGSPSRITAVTYSDPDSDRTVLYVSNGDIWEWDTSVSFNPNWRKMGMQPAGKIKTLATAGVCLFSLDWNGNIRKWDGAAWSSVERISGTPEQIFGAGGYLFAGSLTGARADKNGYSIFAMEATGAAMTQIKSGTGLLLGVAEKEGSYFLGTRGDGILKTDAPLSSPEPVYGQGSSLIIGLIKHGDCIAAVTAGGQIVYSDGGDFQPFASYSGTEFSGAMASWEWENDGGDRYRLLLLGLQRSNGSFGYGYRELVWKEGGDFADNKRLYTPGEGDVSSVERNLQYVSAIGNHAVLALYAVPASVTGTNKADSEGRPIVFASTQKDGFWSYRTRGGRAQWNGEDNSN